MKEGVDYSSPILSGAKLRQAGASFACRYLSHSAWKNLSSREVADFRSCGIEIVCVWETTANRALDGEAAGLSDAREAVRQASALGASPRSAIYFAVDFDTRRISSSQSNSILKYFQGVRYGIGTFRPGVYGGFATVQLLAPSGLVDYYWQTYAWSDGRIHSKTHIHQYRNGVMLAGHPVDLNRSYQEPFGQWDASDSREEEPDMFSFTDPKDGCKTLCDRRGYVFNFNADGSPGGHYLGGLNVHPEWQAGEGQVNGPVVAIEPWDDGRRSYSGYVIITRDAKGTFHGYSFPSDGSQSRSRLSPEDGFLDGPTPGQDEYRTPASVLQELRSCVEWLGRNLESDMQLQPAGEEGAAPPSH